jgi:hypothetical protein
MWKRKNPALGGQWNPRASGQYTVLIKSTHSRLRIAQSRISRDHEHVREPGEISGQVLGDPVGEIALLWVVAKVGKREHCDRQARSDQAHGQGGGGAQAPRSRRWVLDTQVHSQSTRKAQNKAAPNA